MHGNGGAAARAQQPRSRDRKRELVEIAYQLIAQKGLEGFRIRQVAEGAGIDNGTLHYHFPSKQALIQGVVDRLLEDFEKNRCAPDPSKPITPFDELRMEFEDIRLRLQHSREQFVVLNELVVRSWRDPEIAQMLHVVDERWHAILVSVLKRGMKQGEFRKNLDAGRCARAIMVALRGIGNEARLPRRELDAVWKELWLQTQCWVGASQTNRRK